MRAMLCVARRNMSQKLSVFLVLVGLCWGMLLLHYTLSRPRHQSSAQLRQQILDLSRRYVKALSEESQDPSGPQGTSMAGYADLKRTIAVLLDDILSRLVKLEGLVDTAVNASAVNNSHTAGGALLPPPATLQRLLKKDIPPQPASRCWTHQNRNSCSQAPTTHTTPTTHKKLKLT